MKQSWTGEKKNHVIVGKRDTEWSQNFWLFKTSQFGPTEPCNKIRAQMNMNCTRIIQKSRIWETLNLSTNADHRTNIYIFFRGEGVQKKEKN